LDNKQFEELIRVIYDAAHELAIELNSIEHKLSSIEEEVTAIKRKVK